MARVRRQSGRHPAGRYQGTFEAASLSPAPETTEWTAASGQVHAFRVCATQSREGVENRSPIVDDDRRSRSDVDVARQLRSARRSVRAAQSCRHASLRTRGREAAPQSDRHGQPQPGRHARAPIVRAVRHVAGRRWRRTKHCRRARAADSGRGKRRGRRHREVFEQRARRISRRCADSRTLSRRARARGSRCSKCRSPFAPPRRRPFCGGRSIASSTAATAASPSSS